MIEKGINNFDPFIYNTWHSGFDLNGINIPFFNIKERPTSRMKTLRDFEKESDSNQIIKQALDLISNKNELSQDLNQPLKLKLEGNLKGLISNDLLEKVKILNYLDKK